MLPLPGLGRRRGPGEGDTHPRPPRGAVWECKQARAALARRRTFFETCSFHLLPHKHTLTGCFMLQPFRGGEGGRTGERRGKKSPHPQPVLSLTPRPPRLPGRDPPAPHGAGGRAQQPSWRVYFNYHLLCEGPIHRHRRHCGAGSAQRAEPSSRRLGAAQGGGHGDSTAGPLVWGRQSYVGESVTVPQKGPWATKHFTESPQSRRAPAPRARLA